MENRDYSGKRCRDRHVTQITLKCNPADPVSKGFFLSVENRNRELYPTIFSYLNAAVEVLEVSADDGGYFHVLTEEDFRRIGLTILNALRIYEARRKEEQMVP